MGDREQSGQTMHTNRSQSRGKSHVSHAENEKDMQREINESSQFIEHLIMDNFKKVLILLYR